MGWCHLLTSLLLASPPSPSSLRPNDRDPLTILPVQSQYETLQYTHSNIRSESLLFPLALQAYRCTYQDKSVGAAVIELSTSVQPGPSEQRKTHTYIYVYIHIKRAQEMHVRERCSETSEYCALCGCANSYKLSQKHGPDCAIEVPQAPSQLPGGTREGGGIIGGGAIGSNEHCIHSRNQNRSGDYCPVVTSLSRTKAD